jgi:toxin ParE1/3/4
VGRLRYSHKAKADLLDLWLWLAEDSLHIADQKIAEIERRTLVLKDHSELGVARPEIGKWARSLVIERWLVIYIIDDDGVLVMRVVDGARDLRKIL